jgi:hypothetical protein
MAISDAEQKSVNVPYHKRIAQDAKLDGTSLQPKGGSQEHHKKTSGLDHVKAKRK